MLDRLTHLTFGQVVLYAAGLIAAIGIVLALATPAGRDAFALLGLRVADALVALLERGLTPASRKVRQVRWQ